MEPVVLSSPETHGAAWVRRRTELRVAHERGIPVPAATGPCQLWSADLSAAGKCNAIGLVDELGARVCGP